MPLPLASIALCTYNGAVYLKAQLDSLVQQTYANCEIVVVDDCSTDDTSAILAVYADSYPQIKLHSNHSNLGYTKNFEKAISLCSGEYIALCDQDDIWDQNKISVMTELIGDNILAYHDSAFIDDDGNSLNKKLSDVRNCYSGNDSRVFLFDNCVLGHAVFFKRELLKFIGQFNDTIIHDRWLAYVATNNGNILFVDKPLVKYRIHQNANTNILKQDRGKSEKTRSVEKMKFQLDVTTIFVNYPFNNHLAFKKKLLTLLHYQMQNHTSFALAYFIFKHRKILFYIQKKSELSRINRILKMVWGYKTKSSLFNVES